MNRIRKRIIYLIIPALAFVISCDDRDAAGVKFSYQGIIDKEYRFNVGRIIPVTIGQAIETDGDISRDGRYFFYSSNTDGGNFDIYLRSMTDITTVRLTSHPSKDITPVISPNGKRLAFVSFRDDPEGDIFVMKIKPEKLIKKQESSITALSAMDDVAMNVSIEKEKDSQVIINIKDANPIWSPDSRRIAFSSSKGGTANIWIMNWDGSDRKKLTEKGGQYPSFSMDGSKIVFISYRENENGDLYILDLNNGRENRITSDNNIKLYPSFMNTDTGIIYSSIESDTNKNGSLDLQDRSIIRYIDTKKGLTYPLTKKTESSFKAKWLPVLSTRDYSGVIIYTDITGENINLNIIPETGIIPKKLNARLQYEMCDTYLDEYDDRERYLLSLESVFTNFGANNDNSSRAYVDRALEEAALYYKKSGENAEAGRIISIIKKRSDGKDIYASFINSIIEKQGNIKGGLEISAVEKKFEGDKNNRYYLPFALESIADGFVRRGDFISALKYLNYIPGKFPDFERLQDIHVKISLCCDDLRKTGFSDSAVTVLNKGNTNQKIAVIKNLVQPFARSSYSGAETDAYLTKISGLKTKYKDDKKIQAVLTYITGLLYDSKGSAEKSREELIQSITLSHPNDITFYLSNIKLGEIERRQSRFIEAEKYFNAGVNRYSRRFKTENFKERLLWLVNYYIQTGEKSELSSKFKDASETYDKLINLVTLMHNKRLYPEVYSEYAPKAHVLYIDAYIAWKGNAGIADLEKSYNDKLPVLRMDFNRAAIYGLGYIYTKKALMLNASIVESKNFTSPSLIYEVFKKADEQIDWALFIDDTFIEPYILKSWIYQYIDFERKTNSDGAGYAAKYFPKHLWEENLLILEKALNANDENLMPENEGNLHLNMANNYYLLLNYPRALKAYRLAEKYKKNFGSDIEKALFHFHLGYTLWQNGEIKSAQEEIKKAFDIYNSLSLGGGNEKYRYQYLALYRYFALFSREENKYSEAIDWYKKILKYAEINKLTIDRARYFQEMAYCYLKMGRPDSAKYNLDRAAAMLEKYPDDERKYYLRMKLFGLGPFPVMNLGADAAVIGNNKIFYPLETRDKKLLNLSLYEEIAADSGNYSEAIKYLKEKILVLEEVSTSVAVDARIRSLNNLGYYYYLSGKLKDAEVSFNKAGDLSAEKSNIDGTKKSMMNLVNLYAMMIEDDISDVNDWRKKISALIEKIESYRKNYYSIRLAQETEVLEQKAEKKKEKVSAQELSDTRERIEQETVALYYSLDVSASILKYYLAEILFASDPALTGKSALKATDLYSINRDVFNLYKDGIKSFESAISEADKSGSKELKAKLLINTASCYEKTGDYEKAYVSLLDANGLSEKNSLSWVRINSCHKLGNFLYRNGKEVEKTDSLSMADRYFIQAISSIEEFPALYSSHSNRVKTIYKDYINFLIDRGSEKRAFEVAERYAQAARIISISSLSPEFSNEYDRRKYYEYTSELGKLSSSRNEMTSLLLAGSDPASKEILLKKKEIFLKEEKFKILIREIGKSNSAISPYVDMSGYKEPAVNNNIFRFHDTGKGLFYWKLSKGKMTSGYVKDKPDSLLDVNQDFPVFILLSDPVIEMINSGSMKPSAGYIFINTLDRIPYYMKDSNSITGSIYSEEKGVGNSSVESVNLSVAEGKDKSYSDYSVIVDVTGSGKDITPEELFSSSMSPACIIQTGAGCDYQYLTTLMEGAFYAGTKRVIVTPAKGTDAVLPLIKKLYGKTDPVPMSPFFTLGYINTYTDTKISESRQVLEKEISLFSGHMKNADFLKAAVHLARWNSLLKEKNSKEYINSLWLMELLSGRVKNSLAVLDSYTPANEDDKSVMKLRKAYSDIYSGDFNGAEKELAGLAANSAAAGDVRILNALIKVLRDGDLSAVDIISGLKKPYSTILPVERYFMPAAQYLFLAEDGRSARISGLIPDNPYLSKSEHLMRKIINGVNPPRGSSVRFDRISDLWDNSDFAAQREEALRLIRGDKGTDELSVYPVLETLLRQKGKTSDDELLQFGNSLNLDEIISKGEGIMSLILLKKTDDFLSERGNYKERVFILNNILKISKEKSFNSVRKEAILDASMNYYIIGDFQKSYDTALTAEEDFSPEDRSYVDMQLLRMSLYIRAGKFKEAEVKGNLLSKTENLSTDRKFMLNLQLSLLELHRLSSLKNATVADAARFEKIFSSALSLVKKDTEVLNRRGYRDITESVFEEFINYKMRTGQHTDAHYYNEIRKLLIASSKCGTNLFSYAGTIDMDAVQKILPENSLYVNIARIKDDFFVWAADKKSKNAFVIENGYTSFLKTQSAYKNTLASGKDLTTVSRDLANIISPLYAMMKGKKLILVSPDSDSEKIPFEISGNGEMISNKTSFIYIPSLLLSTTGSISFTKEIYFHEGSNAVAAYLGKVAIKESGAGFDTKSGSDNGIIHLSDRIRYNQGRREFTVSGKDIKSIVSGGAVLFAPSDEISGTGLNDFLLSGRKYNFQAVLLNGSLLQDTNNALFIEEFYRKAIKGESLQNSFSAALKKVKGNTRYSYPLNWNGYRLNIYNLNLLKE